MTSFDIGSARVHYPYGSTYDMPFNNLWKKNASRWLLDSISGCPIPIITYEGHIASKPTFQTACSNHPGSLGAIPKCVGKTAAKEYPSRTAGPRFQVNSVSRDISIHILDNKQCTGGIIHLEYVHVASCGTSKARGRTGAVR